MKLRSEASAAEPAGMYDTRGMYVGNELALE